MINLQQQNSGHNRFEIMSAAFIYVNLGYLVWLIMILLLSSISPLDTSL